MRYPCGFPDGSVGKESPIMHETRVRSLGQEDPLVEGMATHSSILAWRIPWTEETGGLQSLGLQRVEHDWSDWECMHAWDTYGELLDRQLDSKMWRLEVKLGLENYSWKNIYGDKGKKSNWIGKRKIWTGGYRRSQRRNVSRRLWWKLYWALPKSWAGWGRKCFYYVWRCGIILLTCYGKIP